MQQSFLRLQEAGIDGKALQLSDLRDANQPNYGSGPQGHCQTPDGGVRGTECRYSKLARRNPLHETQIPKISIFLPLVGRAVNTRECWPRMGRSRYPHPA
jgi:hypothetical protein